MKTKFGVEAMRSLYEKLPEYKCDKCGEKTKLVMPMYRGGNDRICMNCAMNVEGSFMRMIAQVHAKKDLERVAKNKRRNKRKKLVKKK